MPPELHYFWGASGFDSRIRTRSAAGTSRKLATDSMINPMYSVVSFLAPQVEAPGPIFHIFTLNNTTPHTPNLWKKRGFVIPPGLLCRHTASNPITAEMHTRGVQ